MDNPEGKDGAEVQEDDPWFLSSHLSAANLTSLSTFFHQPAPALFFCFLPFSAVCLLL